MRNRLIYLFLFIAIIVIIVYSPLTPYLLKDFMTSRLEKALDMDIVFGKASLRFPAQLIVSDVKAVDKNGPALMAERAIFRLAPSKLLKARIALDCELQKVRLTSALSGSFNDLLKPLGIPPQDCYIFDSVRGEIILKGGSLSVKNLNAAGPDFKLKGNFTRFKDKKVDYDMEFAINKRVVRTDDGKKSFSLLGESEGDWYPVKLSLKGDLRKPASIFFSTGGIKLQVQPTANNMF